MQFFTNLFNIHCTCLKMKHITFSCCYATEFEQHAQPVKLDCNTKFWSIRKILIWRTGWWFQPGWKILVKLCQVKNLPQIRVKIKHIYLKAPPWKKRMFRLKVFVGSVSMSFLFLWRFFLPPFVGGDVANFGSQVAMWNMSHFTGVIWHNPTRWAPTVYREIPQITVYIRIANSMIL